jgi:hypothetical protein
LTGKVDANKVACQLTTNGMEESSWQAVNDGFKEIFSDRMLIIPERDSGEYAINKVFYSIFGEKDPLTSLEKVKVFVDRDQIYIIKDSKHYPHLTHLKRFIDITEDIFV